MKTKAMKIMARMVGIPATGKILVLMLLKERKEQRISPQPVMLP
jgi:hypothetical protein